MPIYEFFCADCQDSFEQILSFSVSQEPVCPSCGSERTRRKLSAPAIHFKGGGFYLTESRKEAETKSEKETSDKSAVRSEDDAEPDVKRKDKDGGSDRKDEPQSSGSNSDKKSARSASDKPKVTARDK